jgi:signal transduction histidine kinase
MLAVMAKTSQPGQRVERLIIGAACAVSGFLLFASGSNFLASRRFAELAVRGEADGEIFGELRHECRPPEAGQLPLQEDVQGCLNTFFERRKPRGLHYVAFAVSTPDIRFTGLKNAQIFAEVGERSTPYNFDESNQYRGRPIWADDNLVYYAMPPNTANTQVATLVFEFEPTQANSLLFLGWLTLFSGIVGVLTTIGGSLLIIRLARQREIANQKAKEKEKLAVLGQMSAVMAHELRNPLASAKGHSQLLVEMLEEGTKAQKKAQQTVQELLRVEHLTNDLLDFIRSGKVNRSLVSPTQIVQHAIEHMKATAPILLDSKGAPAQWSLDALALERVLINLFNNAAQAQPDPSLPIEVSIQIVHQELFISVRDHGLGFPEGTDVLAPFVTTKPTGNGLGLAITEQIIKAHNGRIVLSNHSTQGALVELYIPQE